MGGLYLIRTATRADLDKMIVAAQLPDYALFESLPGAGAQLAPRLIAEVRGNSSGDPSAAGRRAGFTGGYQEGFESGWCRSSSGRTLARYSGSLKAATRSSTESNRIIFRRCRQTVRACHPSSGPDRAIFRSKDLALQLVLLRSQLVVDS